MLSETKSHDPQILRNLIPLSTLPASRFKKLCSAVRVESGQKGSMVFRQGDTKNEFVYLLSGEVSLQAGDVEMDVIEGATEASRFALAHQIPRKVNAFAKTKIQFVRIDSGLIYFQEPEEAITQTSSGYEVSDLPGESSSDWMTELLKSPIFERLPASNLQKVIMGLEEIPVIQGEEIFRQGDTGDYYYIIKSGQCTLTRKPNSHAKEITLAKLKTCDAFGEDALISNQPRNVSIKMLTPGVILRLKKDKFVTLIKEHVIRYINSHSIENAVEQGSILIDLRSPDDYENFHLPESKNIPFFSLRMQMHTFGTDFKPILVCEDGNTSQAAAFLLIREGFTAEVLRGGIKSLLKSSTDSSNSQAKASSKPEKLSKGNSQPKQAEQTLVQLKKDSEQRIDQLNDKLKQSKDSNRSLKQNIQALKQKIEELTNERKEIEGESTAQQSADLKKIKDLESTIQSLEQTQQQNDELYRKNQIAASERITQIEQEKEQLTQEYSESVSALKKEIAELDVQLKEAATKVEAQKADDSVKIIKLESANKSLEETLDQKDDLYRKNQIAASERITHLEKDRAKLIQRHSEAISGSEQRIDDLKTQLKENEEKVSAKQSANTVEIQGLEENIKSLEQTLEQKEKEYYQDLKASSEKITQLAQDRTESIEQHAGTTSRLEKEITHLKERLESEGPKDSRLEETERLFQTEVADYKKQISAFKSKNDSLQVSLTQKSEDIRALESNLRSSQEDNATLHSRLEKVQEGGRNAQEVEATENYQQRVTELEEQIAATQQDKEEKENQVETLKQKATELESVVKNLVDQSGRNGGSADITSLKAELETVRNYANSDIEAMIQQLKTVQSQAKQFKKALRQEKKRVTQLESELDQPLTVSTDYTATDDDIFSTEDADLAPEKTSGKIKLTKKLAFWKS